ncbi:MAG: DUF4372 domain-containing protein [Victivallales bacterium]|nr:DUF4372 domain-containing protein [Victivallales bacterium]
MNHFTCCHQLLTLMIGQLSGRESLRDLTTVLDIYKSKCHHLGLGTSPLEGRSPLMYSRMAPRFISMRRSSAMTRPALR